MAISAHTGGSGSATSGTTIAVATGANVTNGDIIVGVFLMNPSSSNLSSVTKTAGTSTIGSVTTRTKVTNGGVVGITAFFVPVTGTGSLTLTATASGTITSAVFAYEAYSGGAQVNQPTVSANTGTGVDIDVTATAQNAGSWMIMLAGKHGATNIATGTNAGHTHATVEQVNNANPGGTANDVSAAVGSPESITAPNTQYVMDMNGTAGDAYATDAVELQIASNQVYGSEYMIGATWV